MFPNEGYSPLFDVQEKVAISVPNSNTAVHTRTANCDYEDEKTLIGIVWCDQNGNAEVSFNTFKVGNFPNLYSNLNKIDSSHFTIDPGYQVGFPDISVQRESPFSPDLVATVVYQRRLTNNDPWEIAYKRYYFNNLPTTIDVSFVTQPISLGIGKVPAIDAVLERDKTISIPILSSKKNAIAFSHANGYELRIISNNDAVLESTSIPVNIAVQFPDYETDNHVKEIDVAAVCRTGRGASGGIAMDVVHLIYLEETTGPSGILSYIIASWEDIDYNVATISPVNTKYTFPKGIPQAERCKIEAMAIQDYNTTDNHFVALMEIDFSGVGTVIGHNSLSGHVATYNGYLPYEGLEINSNINCPNVIFSVTGFDIAAGVGADGNRGYYTNRHYSIAREAQVSSPFTTNMYLFRLGIERGRQGISHYEGTRTFPNFPWSNWLYDIYATDNVTKDLYVSPQIADSLTNLHYEREGYWLENVSSSASLNTGKFLVKTWIEDGVGVLGNQNYYTNRHHSIARESHFVANGSMPDSLYLFRFGIERVSPALSHYHGQIQHPNSPPNVFTDLYATDNVTRDPYTTPYYLTRYGNGYLNDDTYMLENVSTSSSLNTGKFLVKTWIEAGIGVKFKCFNSEIDIDVNPGQNQWKVPSTAGTCTLYPNPVQDVLSIEDKTDAIMGYTIYSIEGRKLQAETGIDATAYPIDVKRLTMGSYILMTQHASGATKKHKFIKQ